MNTDPQTPPRVICLSPTEVTGDWPAEVAQKLVDQGVDPQSAARIAVEAEAEMQRRTAEARRPQSGSIWQKVMRFLGLAV
jgi:hypothetical protein